MRRSRRARCRGSGARGSRGLGLRLLRGDLAVAGDAVAAVGMVLELLDQRRLLPGEVGKDAIEEKYSRDDQLRLRTAPKPHPDFDGYLVTISPQRGLVKLLASGKTIETTRYGDEVHRAFEEIRDAVSKVYGPPEHTYDFLRADSIWTGPSE